VPAKHGQSFLVTVLASSFQGSTRTAYEPSFLRALDVSVRETATKGTPLGICGEVACAPAFTEVIIGLGVHEFSTSPERLPEVHYNVSRISAGDAQALARRVLAAESAVEVALLVSEDGNP
jgi:phosphoenolpyruvate-protein kinase (PTS system EI component)